VSDGFANDDDRRRAPRVDTELDPPSAAAYEVAAPPDLFDGVRLSSARTDDQADTDRRAGYGLGRLVAYAAFVTGLGILFRFPTTLLFLMPFAGVALAVVTRSASARPFAFTLFTAAFAAQVTSIFITPFTWPLRFGFFVALFGGFGALTRTQLRDLS
jgi:hypothetical protein